MTEKIDKYFASIYLAAMGDKIGFDNGNREQNYMKSPIYTYDKDWEKIGHHVSFKMIFEFISNGGISAININELRESDDTIMHLDTITGLLQDYKNKDELYNNICKNYIDSFKDLTYAKDVLLAGRQTIEAIKSINSGMNWKLFAYNKSAGGNGGTMRTMCLGLVYYKSSNILALIETAIMISSITHPNCISFIGSILSALFTSYAIRDTEPETWIFEAIRLLESTIIDDIIEKIKPNFIEFFKEDKKTFLNKLLTYVEQSFDDNYNYIITSTHNRSIYPWKRTLYYYEDFSTNKKILYPGSGGDDCIIIAYDCLLLSKNNYEKLIYTSMLNIGDSDTIGSIASAWYGALYGFKNIPLNLIIDNNLYQTINKYAIELHTKYFNK
jgi:ADP-ribosylarginine hydrolase